MKLRKAFLGLTLTSALAFPANAADVYRGGGYNGGPAYAAVDMWSGFYAGVNGGGGDSADSGLLSPSGGFGGGQIGYNWQGIWHPHLVLGVEADIQGSGISDSGVVGNTSVESNLNWFGTVRGRAGYAMGPALFYFTGGFAFGEVESKAGFLGHGHGFGVPFSVTETQTGYVLGGGIEYKFSPAWSIKGEYQFISLDASDLAGAGPLGITSGDRSEVNTFRVGVNYHFGQSLAPLK